MISLLNTNFSVYAGNDGNFTIEEVPAGGYILQISAPGYANVHRNIQVPSGSLEIRLVRSSEQLDAITVTAQKREENLQRVPFSISSLPGRKVEEYQLWNNKNLAAVIPNLYASHPDDNRNVLWLAGKIGRGSRRDRECQYM